MINTTYKILLGSQSPRRNQLLTEMDIPFTKVAIEVDETFPKLTKASEIPVYLSQKKAQAYSNKIQDNELLITADTVVILHNQVLEKPKNAKEAKHMLQQLSEEIHEVVTGVSITSVHHQVSFSGLTKVHFNKLSDHDINYYIDLYKPYDKAGAYGIQEWIGKIGVFKIEGCFYNVMGLPTTELFQQLHKFPKTSR